MKVSTSPKLTVADYFNMYNTVQESNSDAGPRFRRSDPVA